MGLDVYVGSLTRYHSGKWETVVQQWARQAGKEVVTIRPDSSGAAEVAASTESVRQLVLQWRAAISEALKHPLEWSEADDTPYFTDKPAWDCFGAVQMLAAYDELGKREALPKTAEGFEKDAILAKYKQDQPRSRYPQILFPEIWLPGQENLLFQAPYLTQKSTWFGYTTPLLQQLRELNERTFNGSEEDFREWRHSGAAFGAPLEESARFGIAVLMPLAQQAVLHGLPMKLDY